ncbi:unnamed protein product [Calypogeia fissa]
MAGFGHIMKLFGKAGIILMFLMLFLGSEITEADRSVQFVRGNRLGNSLRNLVNELPSTTAVAQPPEWMQAPLFHSPRVFAADYAEMKQKLKIYFYPYPANETNKFGFNPSEPLPKGNYASEHYFFRNLHETDLRTDDPSEAHFFVLPFSVFKLRMTIGPTKVSEFVKEYMETLKVKWPYWNRTAGADHLYGTCHDLGVSAAGTTPGLSWSAIQIICAANRWHRNYIPTKDFSFPQIWPRYDAEAGGLSAAERKDSKVLAFWSGSQNSRVRAFLKKTWNDDDEILLGGGKVLTQAVRGTDYFSNFRKAKYCLHVTGFQVPTARIGDAIYFGCVPVILSDQYDLPFKDVLDWTQFAVIVVESNIPNLKTILKSIPDEEYEKLHANVQIVRRLFTWNSPPQDYDIFHMIAYDLWLRRFVTRPSLGL